MYELSQHTFLLPSSSQRYINLHTTPSSSCKVVIVYKIKMVPVTHSLGCCLHGTIRLLFSILYFIVILLKTFFFIYFSRVFTYVQNLCETFSYTFLFILPFKFSTDFSLLSQIFILSLVLLDYYNVLCFLLLFIYLYIFMFINAMPDCVSVQFEIMREKSAFIHYSCLLLF